MGLLAEGKLSGNNDDYGVGHTIVDAAQALMYAGSVQTARRQEVV